MRAGFQNTAAVYHNLPDSSPPIAAQTPAFIVTAIFVFLIFTLLTLTLFSLYCLLACLIETGCRDVA